MSKRRSIDTSSEEHAIGLGKFYNTMQTPYGYKRRNSLMELFNMGYVMCVNGMHDPQSSKDPDLKRLIKQGKLEMITAHDVYYGYYRKSFKRTYLRAVKSDGSN